MLVAVLALLASIAHAAVVTPAPANPILGALPGGRSGAVLAMCTAGAKHIAKIAVDPPETACARVGQTLCREWLPVAAEAAACVLSWNAMERGLLSAAPEADVFRALARAGGFHAARALYDSGKHEELLARAVGADWAAALFAAAPVGGAPDATLAARLLLGWIGLDRAATVTSMTEGCALKTAREAGFQVSSAGSVSPTSDFDLSIRELAFDGGVTSSDATPVLACYIREFSKHVVPAANAIATAAQLPAPPQHLFTSSAMFYDANVYPCEYLPAGIIAVDASNKDRKEEVLRSSSHEARRVLAGLRQALAAPAGGGAAPIGVSVLLDQLMFANMEMLHGTKDVVMSYLPVPDGAVPDYVPDSPPLPDARAAAASGAATRPAADDLLAYWPSAAARVSDDGSVASALTPAQLARREAAFAALMARAGKAGATCASRAVDTQTALRAMIKPPRMVPVGADEQDVLLTARNALFAVFSRLAAQAHAVVRSLRAQSAGRPASDVGELAACLASATAMELNLRSFGAFFASEAARSVGAIYYVLPLVQFNLRGIDLGVPLLLPAVVENLANAVFKADEALARDGPACSQARLDTIDSALDEAGKYLSRAADAFTRLDGGRAAGFSQETALSGGADACSMQQLATLNLLPQTPAAAQAPPAHRFRARRAEAVAAARPYTAGAVVPTSDEELPRYLLPAGSDAHAQNASAAFFDALGPDGAAAFRARMQRARASLAGLIEALSLLQDDNFERDRKTEGKGKRFGARTMLPLAELPRKGGSTAQAVLAPAAPPPAKKMDRGARLRLALAHPARLREQLLSAARLVVAGGVSRALGEGGCWRDDVDDAELGRDGLLRRACQSTLTAAGCEPTVLARALQLAAAPHARSLAEFRGSAAALTSYSSATKAGVVAAANLARIAKLPLGGGSGKGGGGGGGAEEPVAVNAVFSWGAIMDEAAALLTDEQHGFGLK